MPKSKFKHRKNSGQCYIFYSNVPHILLSYSLKIYYKYKYYNVHLVLKHKFFFKYLKGIIWQYKLSLFYLKKHLKWYNSNIMINFLYNYSAPCLLAFRNKSTYLIKSSVDSVILDSVMHSICTRHK
jgi:hypothetical protein